MSAAQIFFYEGIDLIARMAVKKLNGSQVAKFKKYNPYMSPP